ncbi:cystathionine beta-lyase [Chenggangzhangella methanolivorans]|uniref:Cystathionine beta-lyase n=1 Tax=Chenggangzhangella methanolivorans TaxID=1437009 RepID=A0A9E6RCB5_9HYPH|nr:cystathionine beta-lyase [Chenggangzhangella methanolivorans]QZO00613.1 cystathionine beta-lyase [Chenggangzhangella methanolivorans]
MARRGDRNYGTLTDLVTAGRDPEDSYGFVNPPVVRGSTVVWPTVADMKAARGRYTYGRRGTPTSDALSDALQTIEGGDHVALAPSGVTAVSLALLSVLSAGDHLLMVDTVYDPTRRFCDGFLKRMGIETDYYDPALGADISAHMRPNTRAVFVESPGSLTFEVQDVPAIAGAAHARGAAVIMDNTWATPLYFRAHDHGVDLSLSAGTKYLGGHADVLIGYVSATQPYAAALKATHGALGLCCGPDDMFLALRGLRTLGVRLAHHQASGLRVARWLQSRPEVARVMHPGLENDPGHHLWKRDFSGACGLFALELTPGPFEAVEAFLDGLELFGLGYSWGGYESLAIPYDATPIRTASRWAPKGPTVRLHIGLEDVEDLIADLEAGLERYAAAC